MDVIFFAENAHEVVLAKGSPSGISAMRLNPLRGIPHGEPGLSGTSRLKAPATIDQKKRHLYLSLLPRHATKMLIILVWSEIHNRIWHGTE
jgi:hypothetical protein